MKPGHIIAIACLCGACIGGGVAYGEATNAAEVKAARQYVAEANATSAGILADDTDLTTADAELKKSARELATANDKLQSAFLQCLAKK